MINGALTALVAIGMRFAGLLLNIFITRRLGAGGMGLMSLINSVFGFALTFSTGGVSLAATRLCTEALSRGRGAQLKKALRYCFLYAVLLGSLAALFLLLFPDLIADKLLFAPETAISLRMLAIPMPVFSVSAALGGYFSARRHAWKSAVTAVLEQGIKIAAIMLLFSLITPSRDAMGCLLVIAGTVVAELASGALTWLLYVLDAAKVPKNGRIETGLWRSMLSVALPVAFSSYIRSALVTLEHMFIPRGLSKGGADPAAALATYGVVQGMVFPVIFFPTSLLYAFTGLVIPEMTWAKAREGQRQIGRICEKVLHLTLLFSIGCGGVLFVLADSLGMALYKDAQAGYYIRVLAPLVPVMYLDSATDALLKGLGEQVYTMKVNVGDAVFSLFAVMLLVPKFGIFGYIAVVYISEMVNLVFSLARLYKVTGILPKMVGSVALPLLGIPLLLPLGYRGIAGFTALRCGIGFGIYLLYLVLVGSFGKEEKELFLKTLRRRETAS
jgi:stage V sporulation protein B